MSGPRPLTATTARLDLRILSDADVQRVHDAALRLLGDGADAAQRALAQAPSTVVLAGRLPEHDVTLRAGSCWLAAGAAHGPAAMMRPFGGGDPRAATAADLDDVCRLADALPEVGLLAGPPVLVEGMSPLDALSRCFAATTKHVLATVLHSAAEARAAVRLADAVMNQAAGRPPLSLCAGPDGREAALAFAMGGLPVALTLPPGPAAASADLSAALVRHHAGVLAACAAVQAEAPGAPFIYVAAPLFAGLRSSGPQAAMFQIAAAQLAARLRLPVLAGGMLTGSHEPDWQACTQNAFAALSATAARADVTAGAGTLAGGATFSLQELVMDTEIHSWNATIARGVPVDDESIALDAIKDVNVGGNFLSQRHTRRHMRDVWRPRLLDRSVWDAWVASGREGAYEKASALARQLLGEHEVIPLADQVRATVERIVAEAGL